MTKQTAASRQQSILDMINGGQGPSVGAMAEMFNVSSETIRRDLLALEQGGALRRIHGGALPSGPIAPLDDRVSTARSEKRAISAIAASIAKEGQWVFIAGGSTALALAEAMRDGPPALVMTNMPAIGDALQSGRRHQVHITGGDYDSSNKTLTGDKVLEAIRGCSFDVAFMGIYGVDLEFGLVERSVHNRQLKIQLVEQSRQSVFVGDHTKIGATGGYRSIPFDRIQTFVTDKPLEQPFQQRFTDSQTKILHPAKTPEVTNDASSAIKKA